MSTITRELITLFHQAWISAELAGANSIHQLTESTADATTMAHCITHDYRPTAISRHNLTGKQRNIRQSAVHVDYRIKSIVSVPYYILYFT